MLPVSREASLTTNLRRSCFMILIWTMIPILPGQQFDYHREESPAISWHDFNGFDARLLSLAGISIASSPGFQLAINPAVPLKKNKWTVAVAPGFLRAQAFEYKGLPEAELYRTGDPGPKSFHTYTFPPNASLTFSGVHFAMSFGWRRLHFLRRPSITPQYSGYSQKMEFSGYEDSLFTAFQFPFSKFLYSGLLLEWIPGNRKFKYEETISMTYSEEEAHRTQYFRVTAAAFLRKKNWHAGVKFSIPFRGTDQADLNRLYMGGGETFHDKLICSDPLYRPPNASIAILWAPSSNISPHPIVSVTAEANYYYWQGYRYFSFSEEMPRNLRNTLILSVAGEKTVSLFDLELPFRIGLRYDPQPLVSPGIALIWVTGGVGITRPSWGIDLGLAMIHTMKLAPAQNHWQAALTLYYSMGGEER